MGEAKNRGSFEQRKDQSTSQISAERQEMLDAIKAQTGGRTPRPIGFAIRHLANDDFFLTSTPFAIDGRTGNAIKYVQYPDMATKFASFDAASQVHDSIDAPTEVVELFDIGKQIVAVTTNA